MNVFFVFFPLLGLILGSFGNVLLLRIHSEETILGRSRCPTCKKTLAWFDLVPVLSFLFLRGHCRQCDKKISVQYSLVELGSMALFLLSILLFPDDIFKAFLTACALYFLFLACVYDALHRQIPDVFTGLLALIVLVSIGCDAFNGASLLPHFFGAIIPFAWFGMQWLVSKGRAVGSGDIFLGTVIGLWLGTSGAVTMLLLSYMVGAMVIGLLFTTKILSTKQKRIAFGPFMGIATLLTLIGVQDAYLSLLH